MYKDGQEIIIDTFVGLNESLNQLNNNNNISSVAPGFGKIILYFIRTETVGVSLCSGHCRINDQDVIKQICQKYGETFFSLASLIGAFRRVWNFTHAHAIESKTKLNEYDASGSSINM